MKKDSEVIDALAKIAKLKESHPAVGQRRGNVKGWKKFKKQVKRRSTVNEPLRSPVSSPASSPVNTHRSNSAGKKATSTISHDKQITTNSLPITSLVKDPGKGKPAEKPPEDTSISQMESIESSTSLISTHQNGLMECEEQHTILPSIPVPHHPVTNDKSQLNEENEISTCHFDSTVDMELIPQAADENEKMTLLDTLKDTSSIYSNDFGNHEHQEEMMRLFKMLEGDHLDLGPTDPSVLENLNGWRLASKDNM